jgi:hypothetical protein
VRLSGERTKARHALRHSWTRYPQGSEDEPSQESHDPEARRDLDEEASRIANEDERAEARHTEVRHAQSLLDAIDDGS